LTSKLLLHQQHTVAAHAIADRQWHAPCSPRSAARRPLLQANAEMQHNKSSLWWPKGSTSTLCNWLAPGHNTDPLQTHRANTAQPSLHTQHHPAPPPQLPLPILIQCSQQAFT
jgi:hypothetical protein